MKPLNLSSKTLIMNLCIIALIAAIALTLQEPLVLIGLFWLFPLPQPSYNENSDVTEAIADNDNMYDETTVGFTGKMKRKNGNNS